LTDERLAEIEEYRRKDKMVVGVPSELLAEVKRLRAEGAELKDTFAWFLYAAKDAEICWTQEEYDDACTLVGLGINSGSAGVGTEGAAGNPYRVLPHTREHRIGPPPEYRIGRGPDAEFVLVARTWSRARAEQIARLLNDDQDLAPK
jgi:hypothetical protein